MQIIKPDVNINFVGRRRIAYVISALVILASIASLVLHGGPKYGIDFAGGAELLVKFGEPVPIQDVKAALKSMQLDAVVQKYGESGADYYRVLIPAEQAEQGNLAQTLKEGLASRTKTGVSLESFEMVGPQVGSRLARKSPAGDVFRPALHYRLYLGTIRTQVAAQRRHRRCTGVQRLCLAVGPPKYSRADGRPLWW